MTKDEALKLALKALEANQPVNYCMNNNGEKFPMMQEDPFRFERNTKAITAIYEALSQRTWVWLTDEEIADLWSAQIFHINDLKLAKDFVRDIEAKLKEKNT